MLSSVFGSQPDALVCLFFLGGCVYALPAQSTAFVTKNTPDNMRELLKKRIEFLGRIAVLGGQILRRTDSLVGRYFLIRALSLGDHYLSGPLHPSYPDPETSGG